MSQLSDALAWLKRVKKLLKLVDLTSMEEEINQLREGLLKFAKKSEIEDALAPEFTLAMGQLAGALSTDLKTQAELSEDDKTLRQMVLDFRSELIELHRSLESVLTSSELALCSLAVELADNHCSARQFESALRILQQEWHRAKAIQEERSESTSGPTVESEESILDLQPAINFASQALGDVLAKMNPLSMDEQIQCAVFANMLQQLLIAEQLETALSLLVSWKESCEETLKERKEKEEKERSDKEELERKQKVELERKEKEEREQKEKEERERKENEERERKEQEERERKQKEERERKEQEEKERKEIEEQEKRRVEEEHAEIKSRAAVTLVDIKNRVQMASSSLTETIQELAIYAGEQIGQLKAKMVELVQKVENHYSSFSGTTHDEMTPGNFVIQQEAAFEAVKMLEKLAVSAKDFLLKKKSVFNKKLAEAKEKYNTIINENAKAVAELDIDGKKDELLKYKTVQEELKLRDPASDKVVAQLFAATTRSFYQNRLDVPKPNKGSKEYKFAEKIIGLIDHYDGLVKNIEQLETKKLELEMAKDLAVKQEENNIEALKKAQTILWSDPGDIVYGTALNETQLNATLSASNGTIEYFFNGKPVESGKTLLTADDGQLLVAKAKGTDHDIFQKTPDKEVKINVKPAEVAIDCESVAEIIYGTELNEKLLKASVRTTPLMESEHAAIIKNLTYWIDEKAVVKNSLLDAGEHTVTIKTAEHKNYNPAPVKTIKITVKPAELEILWDKPTPTTFTFGQTLSTQQLNAIVVVTTSPPLTSMLTELTKGLKYFDENDNLVTIKTVLSAGEERTITAKTTDRKNFVAAKPKQAIFKVEKGVREIGSSKLDPIGEYVMASDMKQIQSKFKFVKGTGVLEFYIDKIKLDVGVKLKVDDKLTLSAVAVDSSDFHETLPKDEAIEVVTLEQAYLTNKGKYDDLLLKKLHSTHKSALEGLHSAIDLVNKDDSAKNFEKLSKLIEEMEEIDANLESWTKSPIPTIYPNGELTFPKVEVIEDKNVSESVSKQNAITKARNDTIAMIVKLVKHGGISRKNIAKLVPKGTVDKFSSSKKYPSGFKYEWSTPGTNGLEIEIYGHGPTIDSFVSDDSDSKKGNLVRIMIDGRYLRPNGTLATNSTDATSHMALY